MLDSIRKLDPTQPLARIVFYRLCSWLVIAFFIIIYRARFFGVQNLPRTGGCLVIANHQSHLDPPLIGVALRHRNMAAIARAGLFKVPILNLILRGLGCIPIRESEGDAGAIRAAIEQLKLGRVIVIFPEGSRTPDGHIQPFKRGMWLLMSRSGVPVLPAAVEGCYQAWPRSKPFPRLFAQRVMVGFGEPVAYQTLKDMGSEKGLAYLAQRVELLRQKLAVRMEAGVQNPSQQVSA